MKEYVDNYRNVSLHINNSIIIVNEIIGCMTISSDRILTAFNSDIF